MIARPGAAKSRQAPPSASTAGFTGLCKKNAYRLASEGGHRLKINFDLENRSRKRGATIFHLKMNSDRIPIVAHNPANGGFMTIQEQLNAVLEENDSLNADNTRLLEALQSVMDWHSQSDEGLRLRCGELTAQEIRTIRAVLNAILP